MLPWLLAPLFLLTPLAARADHFLLPAGEGAVIGRVERVTTSRSDTLSDIAREHGVGYREITLANPGIDPWLPGEGTSVVVPGRYVLPDAPRHGIVINIPEMRLYFYPPAGEGPAEVVTYPISIGRQDWRTPLGETRIVAKRANPAWYPPESIRREHAEKGDPLPRVVPAGEDNPLGAYALKLAMPGYLLHGTNKPYGLGMRVSHGCIRLYPRHIEELFNQVQVGTPVTLVNQPIKAGWLGDELYLEVHPPLEEDREQFRDRYSIAIDAVLRASSRLPVIDWRALERVVGQSDGIPAVIGHAREPVEARQGEPPLAASP
ncbi:MAG: LysM peptidoglycan-binding domain-containing protein [Gammaproteobacteria bacterium]|nr:MAG: LysM peptidoglycan-binding domain-containing protein [Gammaproteobacteria bacterium]